MSNRFHWHALPGGRSKTHSSTTIMKAVQSQPSTTEARTPAAGALAAHDQRIDAKIIQMRQQRRTLKAAGGRLRSTTSPAIGATSGMMSLATSAAVGCARAAATLAVQGLAPASMPNPQACQMITGRPAHAPFQAVLQVRHSLPAANPQLPGQV